MNLVKTALKIDNSKYSAYTLFELLIVISIFIILGGMTFSAFDGLQNTVKMNEYMLNIEQDIRSVQRSAMLLQRNPGENWIYGIGIDFSEVTTDGLYRVFKWCSPYADYGDNIKTKSDIPGYSPDETAIGPSNGDIPVPSPESYAGYLETRCGQVTDTFTGILRTMPGYDRSITLPKSTITLGDDKNKPTYILFESVSGRAFFYDDSGSLLNYYRTSGGDGEIGTILPADELIPFTLEITPKGAGSTRSLTVRPLSGKIEVFTKRWKLWTG